MKITRVRVVAMSDPVPLERRHRTDLGTKVKSDSAIIFVDTDAGLTGMGAALGTPAVLQAVVEHELGPQVVGEDPMFSERIYEKLYNGSRAQPSLDCGWQQPDPSRLGPLPSGPNPKTSMGLPCTSALVFVYIVRSFCFRIEARAAAPVRSRAGCQRPAAQPRFMV